MRILLSDVLSILLVVMSANLTFAESPWSRFHGVGGLGYVADGEIPSTWTDKDYVWRYELETTDVGSPIVSDGKVYFWASQPTADEITLESLDLATGKRSWSKTFSHPSHHVHNRNTLASSTPAADAKNVFVAHAEPEHTYLRCFDHAGNEIWSRDFGSWQSRHGFGTSPRIFGSMVLLFNSQQANRLAPGKIPGQSRVIAVDRATGKTEWETSLRTTRSCYGIPATHVGTDGRVQLIGANTGDGIFALDGQSGEMLWNLEVFGKRSCSTPIVVGDLAIGTCGSGGGGNELVAVKIPVLENQKPEKAYRIVRAAPYVPTPAVRGGQMFTIADKGIASCLNVKSGQVIWSERIGGNFGASPIIVGDKLLLISLRGEATVLRAAEQFEKLGSFDLGGPVGATPAFSDGRLIVRVGNEIRCL